MHRSHRFAGFAAITAFLPLLFVSAVDGANPLILPRDIEYVGAFRMPNDTQQWVKGGGGMTYRPDGDPFGPADGFPGSLFVLGGDDDVAEVSIPTPMNLAVRDARDLPQGAELQPLTDPTGGLRDVVDVDRLGGVAYLRAQPGQTSPKLYWTIYEYYNVAGVNYLSHGMSEVDLSNLNAQGVWRLGPESDDAFHSMKTANYIFSIPHAWAQEYVGGKRLVSGRHRENGAFGGAQGPALYAFGPWQADSLHYGAELDAVCLIRYPTGGDYFPDYCAADGWSGGAWMDYKGKSAVLIVGSKGTGEQFYGQGEDWRCSSAQGFHCDPYEAQFLFYNPKDLAAVARGTRQPWEVLPYVTVVPDEMWPKCRVRPSGTAFDAQRGILYVIQYNGGEIPPTDGTKVPLVHVFRITDPLQPDPTNLSWSEVPGDDGDPPDAVSVPSPAQALSDPDNVSLSPNPIGSDLRITLASSIDPRSVRVKIYDLSGRLVADLGTPTSNEVQWSTRGVTTGMYFVHVATRGAAVTKKVSIVR